MKKNAFIAIAIIALFLASTTVLAFKPTSIKQKEFIRPVIPCWSNHYYDCFPTTTLRPTTTTSSTTTSTSTSTTSTIEQCIETCHYEPQVESCVLNDYSVCPGYPDGDEYNPRQCDLDMCYSTTTSTTTTSSTTSTTLMYASVSGDAKVGQANPNTNFGSAVYAHVNPKTGGRARYYAALNMAGIESVNQAFFNVWIDRAESNSVGDTLNLYYCNYVFDESTITWSNQPGITSCTIADTHLITAAINSGSPWDESRIYSFDIANEVNNDADKLFSLVLVNDREYSSPPSDNTHNVQLITNDWSESTWRPSIEYN